MWKITEHVTPKSGQDLMVTILIKELCQLDWISYSQSFQDAFNNRVKEITAKNNYTAENMYKITQRNETSVELWKMKANGDFNYKMYTIKKV